MGVQLKARGVLVLHILHQVAEPTVQSQSVASSTRSSMVVARDVTPHWHVLAGDSALRPEQEVVRGRQWVQQCEAGKEWGLDCGTEDVKEMISVVVALPMS